MAKLYWRVLNSGEDRNLREEKTTLLRFLLLKKKKAEYRRIVQGESKTSSWVDLCYFILFSNILRYF